ncbi:MAG: hypothetical protein K9L79_01500 [Methylobacter tundripaludum]|nr:hypothetical protein [Methylobacter tundripaludum]
MVNKPAPIELDSAPIKVRQQQDRRGAAELQGTPPAHVAALLQAEGMSYDPATFAAMTLEQHAEEGFKGLKASVLTAVYSGMHFVQVLEPSNRLESSNKHFIKEEAERRGVAIQTLYNMIDVYKLFCRSPEKCVHAFPYIGITKLIEFKSFDESDLEQLAEGQEVYGITLETAQRYSVRELKSVLQSHRAEVKNLKQRIVDAERKMNVEADKAAELLAENMELKKLTPERRSFYALRKQLFEDMETLQGIVVRARKTYELSKNFQQDVAYEAQEAVIYPLIHLLSVMHGNSKLIMDDCYLTWPINPLIPVNPPQPDSMTHEERWAAKESARYQAALTEQHFPTAKRTKGNKS